MSKAPEHLNQWTHEDSELALMLKDLFNSHISNNYWKGRTEYNWRMGQALMNGIPGSYYSKLSGSLYDPFYKDTLDACMQALDFLTRP